MEKLYQHKAIKFGFIILCTQYTIAKAKTTIESLKIHYPENSHLCVVAEKCHPKEVEEVKKHSKVVAGGDTFLSMINLGMKKPPCKDWNFILTAGSWVRACLDKKFSYFINSEKDILFPLKNGKMNFVDGEINGMLLMAKTYKEVGEFPAKIPPELAKLLWALEAIDRGCKFKAIVGTSIH